MHMWATRLENRQIGGIWNLALALAFWSEFASACAAQVHSLCASVTALYLPFFVFGRVLTGLDLRRRYRVLDIPAPRQAITARQVTCYSSRFTQETPAAVTTPLNGTENSLNP